MKTENTQIFLGKEPENDQRVLKEIVIKRGSGHISSFYLHASFKGLLRHRSFNTEAWSPDISSSSLDFSGFCHTDSIISLSFGKIIQEGRVQLIVPKTQKPHKEAFFLL